MGSLYQYFPNKDAILVELARAHIAEGRELIERRLASDGDVPDTLEQRVDLAVDAAIDSHRGDPRLHQVLFEEAPHPPELLRELRATEQAAIDATEQLLRDDPELALTEPRKAAWFVVATIESLTHRYVASHDKTLDFEAFRTELVTLLVRYLRG